jgi:hypothetical protein
MTEVRDEQYESIPWDALVTDDTRRRTRGLYLLAAVLVIGSLTAAIARNLPGAAPTAMDGSSSVTAGTTEATDAIVVTDETGALLTEAELAPAVTDRAATDSAVATATWFVADYFTLDGSSLTRQSLERLLADHVTLPEPDPDGRSFVESVVPLGVEELGEGRVRVVALVRSLAASEGEDYRRQPARAVEVTVMVSPDGSTVLDLPRPVPLPPTAPVQVDLEPGEAPQAVIDAALDAARLWGSPDPEPLSVATTGDVWRVVMNVGDSAGISWPVAGWFDSDGNPVAAE